MLSIKQEMARKTVDKNFNLSVKEMKVLKQHVVHIRKNSGVKKKCRIFILAFQLAPDQKSILFFQ